jgi:PIN domain nuclease of toxin-antitoxin system
MSGLLLDTHALVWWLTDDDSLSAAARRAIGDDTREVVVSAASAWEIATKQRLGKLDALPPVAEWFGALSSTNGFRHLDVTYLHALRAGGYSTAHRDPFDRMLAAQAEMEDLSLVTRDPAFELFGTSTLW